MKNLKHAMLFRITPLVLVVTFIFLDISWALPADYITRNSTLSVPSGLQRNPIDGGAISRNMGLAAYVSSIADGMLTGLRGENINGVMKLELKNADVAQYRVNPSRVWAIIMRDGAPMVVNADEIAPNNAIILIPRFSSEDKDKIEELIAIAKRDNPDIGDLPGDDFVVPGYVAKKLKLADSKKIIKSQPALPDEVNGGSGSKPTLKLSSQAKLVASDEKFEGAPYAPMAVPNTTADKVTRNLKAALAVMLSPGRKVIVTENRAQMTQLIAAVTIALNLMVEGDRNIGIATGGTAEHAKMVLALPEYQQKVLGMSFPWSKVGIVGTLDDYGWQINELLKLYNEYGRNAEAIRAVLSENGLTAEGYWVYLNKAGFSLRKLEELLDDELGEKVPRRAINSLLVLTEEMFRVTYRYEQIHILRMDQNLKDVDEQFISPPLGFDNIEEAVKRFHRRFENRFFLCQIWGIGTPRAHAGFIEGYYGYDQAVDRWVNESFLTLIQNHGYFIRPGEKPVSPVFLAFGGHEQLGVKEDVKEAAAEFKEALGRAINIYKTKGTLPPFIRDASKERVEQLTKDWKYLCDNFDAEWNYLITISDRFPRDKHGRPIAITQGYRDILERTFFHIIPVDRPHKALPIAKVLEKADPTFPMSMVYHLAENSVVIIAGDAAERLGLSERENNYFEYKPEDSGWQAFSDEKIEEAFKGKNEQAQPSAQTARALPEGSAAPAKRQSKRALARKLFKIVETVNNRTTKLVEDANKFMPSEGLSGDMLAADIRQRVEGFIRGDLAEDASMEIKTAAQALEKDLRQLDADSIVNAIITLARKAEREKQTLSIGLETQLIAGVTDKKQGYGSHRDAMTQLLKEIKGVGEKLRNLGLPNVEIIEGDGDSLAAKLKKKDLPNVVVLASRSTIEESGSLAFLRGTGAFLAGVDMTNLEKYYDDNKKKLAEKNELLEIRLMEMLSMALELAAGKEPSRLPPGTTYDKVMRIVMFLPETKPANFNDLRDKYDAQAKALVAA